MIETFFKRMQSNETPKEPAEYLKKLVEIFDGYVDLLRDSDTFPNSEVNELVTLMWRLIGNKHILTAMETTGTVPSISFAVYGSEDGSEQQGVVLIPQNFIKLAAYKPEMLLGGFAFVASQCRDFYTGKIPAQDKKSFEDSHARATAFEAEALLTLKTLAQEASVSISLPIFQLSLLERFPKGLESLEKGINYVTKPYQKSNTPPEDPNQN